MPLLRAGFCTGGLHPGNDHFQSLRTDAIFERWPHHIGLAVERDAETPASRSDRHVLGRDRFEILPLLQAAGHGFPKQYYETDAPFAVKKVEAQLPFFETRTPADVVHIHFVFVVADEYERSLAFEHLTVEFDINL